MLTSHSLYFWFCLAPVWLNRSHEEKKCRHNECSCSTLFHKRTFHSLIPCILILVQFCFSFLPGSCRCYLLTAIYVQHFLPNNLFDLKLLQISSPGFYRASHIICDLLVWDPRTPHIPGGFILRWVTVDSTFYVLFVNNTFENSSAQMHSYSSTIQGNILNTRCLIVIYI